MGICFGSTYAPLACCQIRQGKNSVPARIETQAFPRLKLSMAKTLSAVDMAINKLRQEIKAGTANPEISIAQLTELLAERADKVEAMRAQNQPTKDLDWP